MLEPKSLRGVERKSEGRKKKDEKTKKQIKYKAQWDENRGEIQSESKHNVKFSPMTLCLRITAGLVLKCQRKFDLISQSKRGNL